MLSAVRSIQTYSLHFYGSKPMSTIDIGIAEAPTRPTVHLSPRALAPDPIHVDFYVGSTKIDTLPFATKTPSAAPNFPTA